MIYWVGFDKNLNITECFPAKAPLSPGTEVDTCRRNEDFSLAGLVVKAYDGLDAIRQAKGYINDSEFMKNFEADRKELLEKYPGGIRYE